MTYQQNIWEKKYVKQTLENPNTLPTHMKQKKIETGQKKAVVIMLLLDP